MPRKRTQLSRQTATAKRLRVLRSNETEDENMHRLATQRAITGQNRARESSADRSQRLASQNARTMANRDRESSAERSQRLASQNARTMANRDRESSAERSQRLATQNARTLANRNRESSAERSQRLASQNSRTLANRDRESSTERSQRLAQQNARSTRNRTRRQHNLLNAAFAYDCTVDYSELNDIDIGRMDKICNLCQAKKWAAETPGLCCSGGKVNIPIIPEPTSVLKELISGSHPLSKHFLNHSRQYNTLFQMTSFGAKEIREGNFMPTFKVQGQVYHLIGDLLPAVGAQPEFLQIYFVSHADQVSLRSNLNPSLQIDLIDVLQSYLHDHNTYIQSFKYNLENRPPNDLKLIIHADVKPNNEHRGRYNAPVVDEVAVLMIDEDKGPRDIVLTARDGRLQRVSEIHRSYDPLQYPLLFPFGNDGYCINIPQQNTTATSKTVSCMQFYAFRFMVRLNDFNSIHYFKGLFNQYCVDMAAKMISERLDFIKRNQKKLRAEEYIHLRDAVVNDGHINASNIGQHVILPSSFTGSPRFMNEKSQDAMTYVRKFGRPDLFITFTCNPEWPEIKSELLPNQHSYDRHDLISRVFHLKLKKMIDLLTKKNIFGPSKAFVYSVEWQKRGLPHAHILLWLANKVQPDSIDAIISAEIPDIQQDPILHNIVIKNMIHGPCGFHNPSSPCMKENVCSKKFPRHFISETQTGDDGYPTYRRRSPDNGGNTAIIRVKGTEMSVDNRWVVPYNPLLSRIFNAHINVLIKPHFRYKVITMK
ncbi:uncharacterized protein LOC128668406 [Microplitis demolitor]|uniref:uncharacterized protein LOC128668406 n=1 Tax=Microplitis demolitor TaxID=69319 RepID=UPI00235B5FF4|nr:uncharacterized protein LOC128668406 [Microplitis demolitor]